MMTSYEKLLPLIEERINQYTRELPSSGLNDPIRYLMEFGGKRIRPAIALMACELFGGKISEALSASVALEVFHNFTLVHDDIMDQAPLRRGKTAVHIKWTTNSAILSGDVMSIHATQLICSSRQSWVHDVLSTFLKTAVEVCEGQQLDMDFEARTIVSHEEYIEMIRLKTAVLLACALKIGASIGGAGVEDQEKLYQFGENMGLAFQIKDDYLDVFGDHSKVGKQAGGDIVSNKKTFLSVSALELANDGQRQLWINLLHLDADHAKRKVEEVTQLYKTLGIDSLALEAVSLYSAKAFGALNELEVPEERKEGLLRFVESLANREK